MSRRSVGLDVLRAACVGGVLATHVTPFFLPVDGILGVARQVIALGSFGVTGFFLVSAYLLMGILLREVDSGQTQIWKRYWIRRILRIWPLYFLAVAAVAAVFFAFGKPYPALPWLATFSYNWISWDEPIQFLGHFWSMNVEEQLYLLIPILCFVAFRWRVPILLILIAIGPVSRVLVSEALPYPAVWNFTTSHLDVFAIGVLLASLDHAAGARWERIRAVLVGSRWVALVAAVLALALIVVAAIDPQWVFGSAASSWTYLLAALVAVWFLLRLTRWESPGTAPVTRAAVWMGQRSYGIYVYHVPAVQLGLIIGSMVSIPLPIIGIVLIAGVLVFSEISFRWIESPFLRLKSRFSSDPAPISS